MEIVGRGTINYASVDLLISSKGSSLYKSHDNAKTWEKWCSLPVRKTEAIFSSNRWSARLTRKEIHYVRRLNDELFVCFGFGFIFLIDYNSGEVENIGSVKGSRPLSVCTPNDTIYYGEYLYNEERQPISLFCYRLSDQQWTELYRFTDIRHIHGVFWDPYQSKIWITTGDLDHESAIMVFNDGELEKIASGSQQARAVDLLFTESDLFFTTDAPDDQNFICKMDRDDGSITKLQAVGGPVFWGRREGNWLFFSTVAEPSEVNKTDIVELWGSPDEGRSWFKIHEIEKDIGHMYLFQYGQIKFPAGRGDGENLYFSPYATKKDHRIIRIPLESLEREFNADL